MKTYCYGFEFGDLNDSIMASHHDPDIDESNIKSVEAIQKELALFEQKNNNSK